jgi:uncharacterized delta-60 repeat protein
MTFGRKDLKKKMRRKISFIFMALFFLLFYTYTPSQAQVNQAWIARYNGPGNDEDISRGLVTDSTGNIYVTGASYDSSSDYDYVTIKYDAEGNQLWVARYNGPGNSVDVAQAITLDSSGNTYVTGYSIGENTDYDYVTIKYDPEGNQLWVARYNGPGNSIDAAQAITLDSSGNTYVTGYSVGENTGYDYATIKYDPEGNQLWVARYNGPADSVDQTKAIILDASGNIYVTGTSYGGDTNYDFATIKYDPSGTQLWLVRYDGTGNDRDIPSGIAIDPTGNIYVTGSSKGDETNQDYVTIKYDPAGNQLWTARYNGPANDIDVAKAIAADQAGNIYITGTSMGSDTDSDFVTIKYNSSGDQLWVARYNGPGNSRDVPHALTLDPSGNIYITGMSYGDGTSYDYTTIKYDTSGNQQWVASYNGPANDWDEATGIELDSSGNIYVTGTSYTSDTYDDYVTIKYTPLSTNTPPYIPSHPSPSNTAEGVITLPLLSWSGGDPDANDSVVYDIYFGTDPNPPLVQSNLETTYFVSSALNYSTTYYWQIVARDQEGAESSSPVWSFTTRSYSASNQLPVANSGPDQVIATGSTVTLEASGSFDPDGDSIGYYWSIISKPEKSGVTISGAKNRTESISFIADADGLYKFQLIVYDGQDVSNPDYVTIRAVGKEAKIIIDTNKVEYQSEEIPELLIWVGNTSSSSQITADVFIGFGLPDGRIYFLDPSFSLVESDPADARTYTPIVRNAGIPSGWIFPSPSDMNADSDGNGKPDTYRLPKVKIPISSAPGQYFAFAALAEPGSVQNGSPRLIGSVSWAYFTIGP